MIKLARRGFLRFLPAVPFAAHSAADQIGRELAGIEISGLARGGYGSPKGSETSAAMEVTTAQISAACKIPGLRKQIESLAFEGNRYVSRIDPDLAVLRSFSLNAKVTFQRQRNVAREMADKDGSYISGWNKLVKLVTGRVM